MKSQLKPAILMLIAFTVLTGMIYPAVVTGAAQLFFPKEANGSILTRDGVPVGSRLIGQRFEGPGYFWSRPSSTSSFPYDAAASSGSNLGPTSPALLKAVQLRVAALHAADPGNREAIPVDLVTSSASGLDPEISPAAALYQVGRVARARSLPESRLRELVTRFTRGRALGILGEPGVNVLRLNLALDSLRPAAGVAAPPR